MALDRPLVSERITVVINVGGTAGNPKCCTIFPSQLGWDLFFKKPVISYSGTQVIRKNLKAIIEEEIV